jgi:hypothetical protein
MRMELYHYYRNYRTGAFYSRTGAVLVFFSGLLFLFITRKVTPRLDLLSMIFYFTLSAIITTYAAAACLRMRKGSTNTPPAIIIDDASLWSWRDGLMPWSEIQAIQWQAAAGKDMSNIIVVWRHRRYSFRHWGRLMDGNGKGFELNPPFYDELKACWERNRRPSGVPSDSDQVVPSRS